MDERLAKKYGHQFKFLKFILELLFTLPLMFLMYYASSLITKDIETDYITVFYDIQETLISEFKPIIILVLFLFFIFLLLFIPLIPYRKSKSILEKKFIKFFKGYVLFAGVFLFIGFTVQYFSLIDIISENYYSGKNYYFGDRNLSGYEKWFNVITFVSVHYLIVWRLSKTIVEYFISDKKSRKINNFFAWIDYDKGYMKVYYKSKMILHFRKYKYWFGVRFSSQKKIKAMFALKLYNKVTLLIAKYHNWRLVKNIRKYQFLLEDIDNDGRIRREDERLSCLLDKSMRVSK